MNSIAILHFQPLVYYPPAQNFIRFLSEVHQNPYLVITTAKRSDKNLTKLEEANIRYIKYRRKSGLIGKLSLIWLYARFNLLSLFWLIKYSPDIILYYETYSAWPAYFYMKLFGRNKKLWMHSHEYFAPEWYAQGMKSVRLYHKKEISYLYRRANGLSHTNKYRVKFFLEDYPFVSANKMRVFPNFPPKEWENNTQRIIEIKKPIKAVYIGSVSLKSTYIKEFCTWMKTLNGQIKLDIYAYPLDRESKEYINSMNSEHIRLFDEGIEYSKIPEIVKKEKYTVGLILYKGIYKNAIYCASNKLFEYVACGLDVWLTDKMIGSFYYLTQGTYPKVIKVNYERLYDYSPDELINHKGLVYEPSKYYCERVYTDFFEKLVGEGSYVK